jgi:hypothetical protein
VDGAGNLFVAVSWYDSLGGCRIRKISSDGFITRVAGTVPDGYSGDGGPATEAKLKCEGNGGGNYSLIAADTAGNVYVADTFNNAIRILRPINGPF